MTNAATKARNSASHCEAKLHAFRKTQDGIVVAFVLHPNEVPESVQLAPLGTRYMLALVEIGDDEQPKHKGSTAEAVPTAHDTSQTEMQPAPETSTPTTQPARATPLRNYAQQSGALCKSDSFILYLRERQRDLWAELSDISDPYESAVKVVRKFCGVKSRSEIANGTEAEQRWLLMLSSYRLWKFEPACGIGA